MWSYTSAASTQSPRSQTPPPSPTGGGALTEDGGKVDEGRGCFLLHRSLGWGSVSVCVCDLNVKGRCLHLQPLRFYGAFAAQITSMVPLVLNNQPNVHATIYGTIHSLSLGHAPSCSDA